MINRRHFAQSALGALATQAQAQKWMFGSPVIDIHLHPRRNGFEETDHLEGTGCGKAVLLPNQETEERAKSLAAKYPGRFVRFTSADVRQPDAIAKMRASLKSGARGLGEIKSPGVMLDGPEMRKAYELAAEFNVPILIHFQEGDFNSGFKRLPAILKQYSKTTFIAHANSWWANISLDAPGGLAYPEGKVTPGGLTDQILSDFPNIWGDLSANSGRNALQRDPAFAARFLARHQGKLMFGSDCSCKNGQGGGNPPPTPGGKCVAIETLTTLKSLVSPQAFETITWGNATKLLKLA